MSLGRDLRDNLRHPRQRWITAGHGHGECLLHDRRSSQIENRFWVNSFLFLQSYLSLEALKLMFKNWKIVFSNNSNICKVLKSVY